MSYESLDTSHQYGAPVHILSLASPSFGAVLCNATLPINGYTPCPFTFGAINQGSDSAMTFSLPVQHPTAIALMGQVHETLNVGLARYHQDLTTEQVTIWTGLLDKWQASSDKLRITATPRIALLETYKASLRTSRRCQWVLYGHECTKVPTEFAHTVIAVSGRSITVDSPFTKTLVPGGRLRFGQEHRFFVGFDGPEDYIMSYQLPSLAAEVTLSGSATVYITSGCDKSSEQCEIVHDNLDNFGGFEAKPKSSLFKRRII